MAELTHKEGRSKEKWTLDHDGRSAEVQSRLGDQRLPIESYCTAVSLDQCRQTDGEKEQERTEKKNKGQMVNDRMAALARTIDRDWEDELTD